MNREELKRAVNNGKIKWQRHALERMLERGISREMVKEVLLLGEIVENYPDDRPFSSALMLGIMNKKPLHVVVALDTENGVCYIITVYRPDSEHFEADYKTRRYHGD